MSGAARFFSRRFMVLALALAGITFIIGALISQILPKAKSWLLVSIDTFSQQNLPVRVLPQSISFQFFPLGFSLNNVRILPTKELESPSGPILAPLNISTATLNFSLIQILQGQVAIDEINLEKSDIIATVPKSQKTSAKPLEGLFQAFDKIPIRTFIVSGINAKISIPEENTTLRIENLKLKLIHPRSQAKPLIETTLSADSILINKRGAAPHPNLVARLTPTLVAAITPDRIKIEKFEIQRGSTTLETHGELSGDTEALRFEAGNLIFGSDIEVKSTRDWLQKSFLDAEVTPPMTGRLQLQAQIKKQNKSTPWTANFSGKTQNYTVEHIDLDKIEFSGSWDGEEITLPEIVSQAEAGRAEIKELRVGQGLEVLPGGGSPWLMRIGSLSVSVELHEFLTNMGIGPIPVWLSAEGKFPCESELTPKFIIRCGGQFSGKNLIVQNSVEHGRTPDGAIAGIPSFTSQGEFSFDLEKFQYKAKIDLPNSQGSSHGEVFYKKGFQIFYDASNLAIKDLSALGGLKLQGALKLKGKTEGNSETATLQMAIDGQDLWLDDFWLGYPKGIASYKAGTLKFSNLQGYYTTSRYSGDVAIDLHKSMITTTLRVPFFDAKDLLKVFSRKFQAPFPITGTGQASIKSSGPFDISKMTYDLRSSLFKGSIAGETFEQAHFDVRSDKGNVKAERVSLSRGTGLINLTGNGFPNGTIDTVVTGKNLHIEETNLITESGFNLSGIVNFDMALQGPVLAPDANLKGVLTQTILADSSMPDSHIELSFKSKTIEGRGVLMGDVINTSFIWPLTDDAPMSIIFQSKNWNFAPVFAAMTGPEGRSDFEGLMSADINLKSTRGGFWASSGDIRLEKLSLRRGAIHLTNNQPLLATVKGGQFTIHSFELTGEDTFLRIEDRPSTHLANSFIDIQVNSKIDLNLFSIFTPFFEELRGLVTTAITLKFGPKTSDVIGTAFIDRTYIKFPEFPYPFDNLQSDIVFNHKKISINSIRSNFAEGKLRGSGSITLRGEKDYPVNITGTFSNINLNLPEKIRSKGSGNFQLLGSYFPFLLKGQYDIREGLFSKELGDTGNLGGDDFRRSLFLPKSLTENAFLPLLLDLNIDFSKSIIAKNNLIDGSATGTMHIEGAPTRPRLTGIVRANPDTKITFRENIFDVSSAILTFDDPVEINPHLSINARTRVDDYNVNLQVTGTGKKPEITVSSVPPLPEKDILSLLALGTTDQKLSENVGANQQSSGASQQLLSGVANEALKGVTKGLGVDVQLSPGFDNTDEAYQRVVIKKQFNRKLDVSGSRSLGKKSETEARLRYKFTDRVSGVLSGQVVDQSETSDTTNQQYRSSEKLGLDFEYKFEFK